MKRSEMRKLLKDVISKHQNCCNDWNLAEHVLFLIEKEKMLPPGYLKPIPFESDGRQYPLVPGDFQIDGIWCTPGVNEWENE